ncbi:hypothetical protein SteCoe_3587 [Stentor coeruleus]|uniref:Condensin complex subunit 1 C-terminal domain-containing protein n=1 Tax=Stentor coeruleus TaxID=5963 RepID=A0A1R2CWT1_9CILI|nr:hypothetical protein SteCoe_3587 [Stentor coeruleus]
MEFHSEWLLEDPIDALTDLKKEVISKDEIEKLSTKENLSEIDKACTLLENGQICQKLWVVKNLHNIMYENRFHEIIAELINRLPYWNESGQEEAGKALTKVLAKNCFPIKYSEHLLNLALQIIDSETWTLQKSWGEVLAELAKHLPEKLLLRCTQEAMSLSAYHQNDQIRSIGGIVLGAIADARKKPPSDITRKIFSMSQDPSNFVRLNMCETLRILFKLKGEFESKVIEEILKLVGDECVEVLEQSLQLFVDILPEITEKNQILENVEECFVKTRYDKLTEIKLRYIGRVMKELKGQMSKEMKNNWVNWIMDMVTSGNLQEKRSVSISYGGIIHCTGIDDRILQLWKILEDENDYEVIQNLVLQIGFVASIAGDKTLEVQGIVRKYVKIDNYFSILVPQITIIATSLKIQEELLLFLVEKLTQKLKMRDTLEVLCQLVRFSNTFNIMNPLKPLIPNLIQMGKEGAAPVKEKSMELLAIITYKSPGYSSRLALAKDIIQNFACSNNCFHRASYISFCLAIKNFCSRNFFSKIFMPSLLDLSKDKSDVVRYTFAKNYVGLRYTVPSNNSELMGNFRYILNSYLEIDDKVLLNYALAADEGMNNVALREENYGPSGESVENMRIKQENDEEIKEITEMENTKKIQNEENLRGFNRKTNKKYLGHRETVPRQSSVKPMKKYNLSENDRHDIVLNKTRRIH